MTVEIRTAGSRPVTRAEGRTTWHSFSFGAHYDPRNVGLGRLVAHNDELLPPGTGYADHPHADLEIVTWVLTGALRHESTVGTGTVTPGRVQQLSAGRGVRHSEVSAAPGPTRFLQAWVRPDEPGTEPHHVVRDAERGPGWTCLADDTGSGAVTIAAAGTSLHVADLAAGDRLSLPEAPLLHVFVATGQLMLGERRLGDGDAARLGEEGGREVRAEQDAHVVVWALTEPPRP
ncbi:pirin-like bicupin family protein [Nocardioides korecus]